MPPGHRTPTLTVETGTSEDPLPNPVLGRPLSERRRGTLESGLDILETLAASTAGGLGVTDLARRLDQDKGNVHRLLRVLAHRGYVQQDPGSRHWSVTVQLVALAGGVLRNLDARTAAESEVRALVDTTGESSHLALRTRTGGIYVAQERPYGRVSVDTEIGSPPLLHATASGKALLAWLDRAEWRALVQTPLQRCTEHTIGGLDELDLELMEVRARGYAIDSEEFQPDVRCVAAPIFDHHGAVIASLGASGPADRVTTERLSDLGNVIRAAADRITTSLGGVPTGGPEEVRHVHR